MKRALPVIVALALTFFAAGAAGGLNLVLGSVLAPTAAELAALGSMEPRAASGGSELAAERSSTSRSRVKSEREYLNIIMGRNIFDPDAIAAWNPSATADNGAQQQLTDLKVRLVGTMVAEPSKYSAAFIVNENDTDSGAQGYSIGHKIQDAEIIDIEDKKVTLKRGDGNIEVLTASDDDEVRPSSSVSSSSSSGGAEGGVEQIGENKFAVDRSLIEQHIGDLEGISKMGRALLHRGPDGEFDGYRLSAIRRNTLADQLGIKNGDVVHTVNGQSLNSVQNAMGAYQGLTSENAFSFEITRRGQTMTLEYEIR